MNPISVRVPTASLQALLAEHPEIELRLESMACEKIAEEMMRKTNAQLASGELGKRAKKMVEDAVNDTFSKLKSKWNFPTEGKAVITELVTDQLTKQVTQIRSDMIKGVSDELKRQTAKIISDAQTELYQALNDEFAKAKDAFSSDIRALARAEFLSVLHEAKQNLG